MRDRLDLATRGAATLEQKLRVLRREQQRFLDRERRTAAAWRERVADAEALMLRASLLGGQRTLRMAELVAPTELTVQWGATMGIRHPDGVRWVSPSWPSPRTPPCGAATAQAGSAYAAAAVAAVEHAVARAACERITTELAITQLRVRALRQHWLPRLRQELAAVEFELEELERAEGVRRRWAQHRPGPSTRADSL
ncbi:V-type ATP synthase subunit D [Kutzneria viridogrisea]|uniref:V-type ATP synthase subunit D n=1 Tax=Kutzneria TaxID=43356 RepID=UPI00130E63AC|nr:V-type ATP synthase subunit D [Kutzneria albida]